MMKLLVVGGGGREHALAWKAAQSDKVETIYVAPGNAGTAAEQKIKNIPIKSDDIYALKNFALKEKVELTIVGPEMPLCSGIVDVFQQENLLCFGPTKAASILEGSKVFAKKMLKKYQIPTAEYEVFTDIGPAIEYIKSTCFPIVIKADGLAAGKGVVIAWTEREAINTIHEMLTGSRFGSAGRRIVIEEFLEGEEVSFIVVTDGEQVLPLASSQDYKARDDGDKGPNTGGMGAHSPAPIVTSVIHDRIMEEIIMPIVKGMMNENRVYTGFLYAGLIITKNGILKVLEFNCRFGDPEAQSIMMRLKSDLPSLCLAAINKTLDQFNLEWDRRAALGVVTASAHYPESVSKGKVIIGLDSAFAENVKIFHGGTGTDRHHNTITAGGRVLCVTALGNSIAEAQKHAYIATNQIDYEGMFYRTDIGHRAIEKEI